MSEFSEALKQKYLKQKNTEIADKMGRQRVKGAILNICETYLQDSDDVLKFEVLNNDLQYAVEVVTDESVSSRFDIRQISETVFVAKLVSFDID